LFVIRSRQSTGELLRPLQAGLDPHASLLERGASLRRLHRSLEPLVDVRHALFLRILGTPPHSRLEIVWFVHCLPQQLPVHS
jgi:hypothetical protein